MKVLRFLGILAAFFVAEPVFSALEITTATMPNGMEVVEYSVQLEASGGVPPYEWEGHLPPAGSFQISTNGVLSGIPDSGGWVAALVIVRDSQGSSANKTLSLYVEPNPNTRPVIDSITPFANPFKMEIGSTSIFSVAAHDPEGTALSYSWLLDGQAVGSNTNSYTFQHTGTVASDHDLYCYISDGLWTNQVYVWWNVETDQIPPQVVGETLPDVTELVEFSVQLEASGGVPPYQWTGALPSNIMVTATGMLSGVCDDVGTLALSVYVEDSRGLRSSKSLRMEVLPNPNTRPVIDSRLPSDDISIDEGANAAFSVNAHDAEGAALNYLWMWDGEAVGTNASSYTHQDPGGYPGMHELTCYVSDGLWTNQVSVSWNVDVIDLPPQIIADNLPDGRELEPYSFQLESLFASSNNYWRVGDLLLTTSNSIKVSNAGLRDIRKMAAGGRSPGLAVDYEGYGYPSPFAQQPYVRGIKDVASTENQDWALNYDGSLITNVKTSPYLPIYPIPERLGGVTALAASEDNAVAITAYGSVIGLANNLNQYNNGFYGLSADGSYLDITKGGSELVEAAVGTQHRMVLTSDGRVEAWLLDLKYDAGQTDIPEDLTNAVAIAAGSKHSLILRDDGTVFACGDDTYGQCQIPAGLSNVVAISAGGNSSVALLDDGGTVAWGVDIGADGLEHVAMIAAGKDYCMVLKDEAHCLPPGLRYIGSGRIEGTPTKAGQYEVLVQLTSSGDAGPVSKMLPINIDPAINLAPVIDTALPEDAVVSFAETGSQTFSITATDPEGAALSYRWSLDGEDVATNVTSYTVQTQWGEVGSHTLRCFVFDGTWSDDVVYKEWPLYVQNIRMEVLNSVLPDGVEQELYSQQLMVTNGLAPYSWHVASPVHSWGVLAHSGMPAPEELVDVVEVDAGYGHHMVLKADGTALCWGRRDAFPSDAPTTMSNVVAIAADVWQRAVVYEDGRVSIWGSVGSNITLGQYYEYDIEGVEELAGGGQFTVALTSDGDAFALEHNYNRRVTLIAENCKAVAAGKYHALLLKDDGTVVAWGDNDHGGCEVPAGLSGVIAVSAGEYHSLALKADGTVVAWGEYIIGSTHMMPTRPMFVPEGLNDVVAISAGFSFNLALKSDGSVVSWGNEEMYPSSTTIPGNLGKVNMISAGYGCIALQEDALRLPEGLTLSEHGLISGTPKKPGCHTVTVVSYDSGGERIYKDFSLEILPNENERPVFDAQPAFSDVSVGFGENRAFSVSATDPEGAALSYRWFLDDVEQAEVGPVYQFIAPADQFGKQTLRCIISDGFWQEEVVAEWIVTVGLGSPNIVNESLPVGMQRMPYQAQLVATNGLPPYRFCADPQLRSWGSYDFDDENARSRNRRVVKICSGWRDGLFLTLDEEGTLDQWSTRDFNYWPPDDLGPVKDVDCGWFGFVVAVKLDGTVCAWGNNRYGNCDVPAGLTDVIDVEAGAAHTLALRSDGTVVSWGDGMDTVPAGLSNVVAVAAGDDHDLAALADGTVIAWGNNDDGACDVPVGLSNVVDVAAGDGMSLALCSDGTVVDWGVSNALPAGLSNVVDISCGSVHCLALSADGELTGWGITGYSSSAAAIPAGLGSVMLMDAGYQNSMVLCAPTNTLSNGLELSSDGVISGVPAENSCSSTTYAVIDDDRKIGYKTLTTIIAPHPNQLPPIISFVLPDGPAVDMGEAVSLDFTVDAYDPEGSNLVYRWSWDGADLGTDLNAYTRSSAWGDAGLYTLGCTVSDGHFDTNAIWNVTILSDNDGDGVSNAEERRAGTNPMDPDSVFGIRGMQERTISFHSVPGRTYQVFSSDDLVTWTPSGGPIIAGGSVVDWTAPAADVPCRFYRIVVAEAAIIP